MANSWSLGPHGGASELAGEGIEVLGHRDDKMLFEQPGVMSAFAMPGMEFSPIEITRWIEKAIGLVGA